MNVSTPQTENDRALLVAQIDGPGLCEISDSSLRDFAKLSVSEHREVRDIRVASLAERSEDTRAIDALKALQAHYKQQGQLVQAMAIESAIQAVRRALK